MITEGRILPGEKLELASVLQELKENPYRKFNLAFSAMSVIPFLVFVYLIASRFFTLNALSGNTGLVLFLSVFIAVCGLLMGYGIINDILSKLIVYAVQARRSDCLKSTYVSTVSHELKNPLSIIKTNLYNLVSGFLGEVTEEQKSLLELCRGIVDRMNRLIMELLDLHKIEAGAVEVKRELCSLKEILEGQIKEFEAVFEAKKIKLCKEFHGERLGLWGDQEKIGRVVSNILSNAAKFTPENGSVTLKAYPAEGFVRFECIDSGPGIPGDKIGRLFNKFERLDLTKEGTGLGLAITKDIVSMHRGKIWAEPAEPCGGKFVVALPCDLRRAPR